MVMATTGRDMMGCLKLQQESPGTNNFVYLKLNAIKVASKFSKRIALGQEQINVTVQDGAEVHTRIPRCFSTGITNSAQGSELFNGHFQCVQFLTSLRNV